MRAYNRVQQAKERELTQRRAAKSDIDRRVQRLQEIYKIVLTCFQNVKLQRRHLREAFVPGQEKGTWKIRRGLFEEVYMLLNEAQLSGERVMKTLIFEHDSLAGTECLNIKKLQYDLKSQVGGIQGILRKVLKTAEWKGVTEGTSNDENLINVPDGVVKFAEPNTTGNLGFRKIGEYFDAFSINILTRIRELESESSSFGETE